MLRSSSLARRCSTTIHRHVRTYSTNNFGSVPFGGEPPIVYSPSNCNILLVLKGPFVKKMDALRSFLRDNASLCGVNANKILPAEKYAIVLGGLYLREFGELAQASISSMCDFSMLDNIMNRVKLRIQAIPSPSSHQPSKDRVIRVRYGLLSAFRANGRWNLPGDPAGHFVSLHLKPNRDYSWKAMQEISNIVFTEFAYANVLARPQHKPNRPTLPLVFHRFRGKVEWENPAVTSLSPVLPVSSKFDNSSNAPFLPSSETIEFPSDLREGWGKWIELPALLNKPEFQHLLPKPMSIKPESYYHGIPLDMGEAEVEEIQFMKPYSIEGRTVQPRTYNWKI